MSGATENPKNYEARIIRDRGICGGNLSSRGRVSPFALCSPVWPTEIPPKTSFPISQA
jgi:hypothetical protein